MSNNVLQKIIDKKKLKLEKIKNEISLESINDQIEKNNKKQIQLDETNEKMDALKVKEIRSFRNNRKYSEEFRAFYKRLKGI